MNNWKNLFDRRNLPAWVTLLACVLLTLAAWQILRTQIMKNAEQQFGLYALDITDSIEERLRHHEQILLGGAGLFDASETVNRNEWRTYIERLRLKKNYPGILGVGYSLVIKPANLQAHIAATRAEGFPNYTVRPPGERPLYTAITFLEPFSGRNLAAFGYDMMSETTRAKAMRLAAESGKTSISGKVKLVQETHGKEQAGFLMYVPVYRKNQPLTTAEERWNALTGFVYSPYRVDDLMAGIMSQKTPMLDFDIFDGNSETNEARMYSSADNQATEARVTPPEMTALRTIHTYGHTWTVRLNSRPEFEASFHSPLNNIILTLGGSIDVLLFVLVSFLISRRKQAEALAERMTRDIRINEEKLSQSEARIRAIVDGADHLIITTDTNGIIRSFNRSAEKNLGYRAEELIGKLTPAIFHDPDEVVRRARELTAAGTPVEPGFETFVARARTLPGGNTHEWTYIRKNGSRFPVSLTITALRGNDGNVNAFLGIATDITERNLAARMKRDEAARINAILDNVLDGIITISEQGIVESFNKSAENIFGYAAAEVIGNNVKMLMPEPYHAQHDGYLHNYVSTGIKKIIGIGREVTGQRKDGSTFPMDLAVSEMYLGDKRMFTGIVRDITERVKVERMKNEFVSTVSHELRTPLTSIRGSLGLLAGGIAGSLPEQAKALIDIAHKNSERLILLVNDILDMEKIESGKMEFHLAPIELMPLLKQAMESNQAYAKQFNVSYEIEISEPLAVRVNVDANRLLQVLANLLSNAAKFSPSGGTVVISTTRDDTYVRVNVTDRGCGIPKEFYDQVFQKFAQADSSDTRKKGGTGLGLSITKAIVEQMGGRIGFDSQPNVSTTFFIEFPIWQEAGAIAPTTQETGSHKRVLICENDRDVAALLLLTLEGAGLAANIANNAAQAKQMLAQHNYAAMVLSLALPNQSGIALIRELRAAKQTATLPIVAVSANTTEGHKELNGEAFNVIDWFSKPIDRNQVVTAIKQATEHASNTRPKVLHIKDDPDIFQVVNAIVGKFAELDNAASLTEARRMLKKNHYDLAILDISLPDGSGMKLLPILNRATPPIPVMVFSANEMGVEKIQEVKSALVKSRTSDTQLLATIKHLIGVK